MTFYFYDLETSGRDCRTHRIMQFAGQRTDANLNPIGEPFVTYVKLSDDILPEPEAVLLTGITPQITQQEGVSEPEFLARFQQEVLQPDTYIAGFNTISFDDEFMRFTMWRNFYDPYAWHWQDGRCRWDILKVVRMTRALKPDGIVWPVSAEGKPTNRLEELTELNNLQHDNAHDALSDVHATIAVAKLLRDKQPKLFDYLLSMNSKKAVLELINPEKAQPFVHTSGRISSDYAKTSVFLPLFADNRQDAKIVCYDLRFDPTPFISLSVEQLRARLFARREDLAPGEERLPLKGVHAGRCPAIAPLGVLQDANAQANIKLTLEEVEANRQKLGQARGVVAKLYDVWQHAPERDYGRQDPEASLYSGGFTSDHDRQLSLEVIRRGRDFSDFKPDFNDERLVELFLRYKARNFPDQLTEEEHEQWESYRRKKLLSPTGLRHFGTEIQRLAALHHGSREESLLTDLQLYGESVVPLD